MEPFKQNSKKRKRDSDMEPFEKKFQEKETS